MQRAKQHSCCWGNMIGKIGKTLLSFVFISVLISGSESIEDNPELTKGGRGFQNVSATTAYHDESNLGSVSPAYGNDGSTLEAVGIGDGEDIDGQAYALFSPHVDMVSKMAPGSAIDGDWVLTFEQGRGRKNEKDPVFYGDDRKAVLEPGAISVLGFGLIGLFTIVRLRLKK
ncbi:hypothetical protein [Desulfococcus sp.]|uniref:hypothetical protein n=1 Tax=Desulfococcus sp. TaxID=2025834 RepID=UPI00359357C1